jgi:hypothetical protein
MCVDHPWVKPWLVLLLGLSTVGCSGRPSRLKPPSLDAETAAATALQAYDADGNGLLSAAELAKAPSLKASLGALDADHDEQISAEEIANRIRGWGTTGAALVTSTCRVTQHGRPVGGATVTFEPEPFLTDVIHPAFGTTGNRGMAELSVAEQYRPGPKYTGVQCGFYRVKVSREVDGKETIPAQYNSQTTLGMEVSPSAIPPYHFDLK